jgi:hypothetical protein
MQLILFGNVNLLQLQALTFYEIYLYHFIIIFIIIIFISFMLGIYIITYWKQTNASTAYNFVTATYLQLVLYIFFHLASKINFVVLLDTFRNVYNIHNRCFCSSCGQIVRSALQRMDTP